MRDFDWPENGNIGMCAISPICETWPMRGFANFGNRGRCAISIGRETEHWPGNDFAYLETRPMRDFANLGNRGWARFYLAGKRNHWPGNDFAYLENMGDARFR